MGGFLGNNCLVLRFKINGTVEICETGHAIAGKVLELLSGLIANPCVPKQVCCRSVFANQATSTGLRECAEIGNFIGTGVEIGTAQKCHNRDQCGQIPDSPKYRRMEPSW